MVDRLRQRIWARVRSRALKEGIPFTIEPVDIPELPAYCPALGTPLSYLGESQHRSRSASLDRIVPELGYVPGNVRILGMRANTPSRVTLHLMSYRR